MTPADKEGFGRCLAALAEIFPLNLCDSVITLYWNRLAPKLTYQQFEDACAKHMDKGEWFPKPKHIIELALGSTETQAMEQWEVVQNKVSHIGAYGSPSFEDPVTVKAVQAMGGWQAVCRPTQSESWQQKRFLEAWQGFEPSRKRLDVPKRLIGLHGEGAEERPALPPHPDGVKDWALAAAADDSYDDDVDTDPFSPASRDENEWEEGVLSGGDGAAQS